MIFTVLFNPGHSIIQQNPPVVQQLTQVPATLSRLLPTACSSLVSSLQKGIVPCNFLEPMELQHKLHVQVRSPGEAGGPRT